MGIANLCSLHDGLASIPGAVALANEPKRLHEGALEGEGVVHGGLVVGEEQHLDVGGKRERVMVRV